MQAGVVSFALYLLHPVVEKGDLFLVFEVSVQEGISTNVLVEFTGNSHATRFQARVTP